MPEKVDQHEKRIRSVLKKIRNANAVTMIVKRDSLKPAAFNPQIRVQMQYLKDLRESMATDGFWEFCPILVDKNGVIIDGHRRWTAAGLLHIEEVPVTMVDADADELWAKYNGTRMDVSGKQAMQAIANGLRTAPTKYAGQIARLEDVVGIEGVKELGNRGVSPFVINQAVHIARYCGLADDKPFIGITVYWMVNNKRMSTISSRAINDQVDPTTIERAIRANRPLTADYR